MNGKGNGPRKGYNHQKYAENYDQIFRTMKPNQEKKPMTPDQPTATATNAQWPGLSYKPTPQQLAESDGKAGIEIQYTAPEQPTATATPIYRFSLASWLSIYGRTCLMDFVKETDYATLERELSSAQAALAEAKAEVARLKESYLKSQSLAAAMLAKSSDELTALRAELQEREKQCENYFKSLTEAHALLHEVKVHHAQGLEHVRNQERTLTEYSVEVAALRARVAELEAENATLKVRFTNITTNAKTCYPAKGQP